MHDTVSLVGYDRSAAGRNYAAGRNCQIQRTLGDRQRIGVIAVDQRIAVDRDRAVDRIGGAERERSREPVGSAGERIRAFRLGRVYRDRISRRTNSPEGDQRIIVQQRIRARSLGGNIEVQDGVLR